MDAGDLLKRGDLFAALDAQAHAKLASQCTVRLVDQDSIAMRAGATHDAVVYLAQGKVALYRRNPKRDVTLLLGIIEGPSLFGDAECAAATPWMCSVRAETDSWLVMIPNAVFVETVASNAQLAARLYHDASVRHLLANHTAQVIALYDVETRLIRLLLDYAHRFGRREGDDAQIEKPLSQVEMASALGVTRKTIARTLTPLEKSGVVSRLEGSWRLHGLAELESSLPRDLLGLTSRHGEEIGTVTNKLGGE